MDKETSEIGKLTERISKDPRSKLFVPLAEEYKKIGDIEMAIHVLTEGLKNNPRYVTARSFLGRLLMETGDLAAAQKEFEEVVIAAPDNLLALRKLGDVYALQNKPAEALKHYKIIATLNLADQDVRALVADLEAGLDITPRLRQQKGKPSSGPAASRTLQPKESPAAPGPVPTGQPQPTVKAPEAMLRAPLRAAAPYPAGQPTFSDIEEVLQKTEGPGPEASASHAEEPPADQRKGPFEEAEVAPKSAPPTPEEEAEEVLLVEPLEEELPIREELAGETIPAVQEFPGGAVSETAPSVSIEEEVSTLPGIAEQPFMQFEMPGDAETAPALAEEAEELLVTAEEESLPAQPAAASPEAPESPQPGASDEFTTDTLAELYIAQGFYEKAIDIYERLLAEHPQSQPLRDKLERVRAMAAAAETPQTEEQVVNEAPGPAETIEFPASFEEPGKAEPAGTPETVPDHFLSDSFTEAAAPVPPAESLPSFEEVFVQPAAEQREPAGLEAPGTVDLGGAEEEVVTLEAEVVAESAGGDREEAGIFAETIEPQPVPLPQVPKRDKTFDIFAESAADKTAGAKPAFSDFEPREYVPPTAELRQQKEAGVPAAPRHPVASRQETIDRLENWLKNIKKEK